MVGLGLTGDVFSGPLQLDAVLGGNRMVGLEEVLRVVTLLDLPQAAEDLRGEYLRDVEALLNEVEIASGIVRLECRLERSQPRACRCHSFRHRDKTDGEGEEGARQSSKRAGVLWCP